MSGRLAYPAHCSKHKIGVFAHALMDFIETHPDLETATVTFTGQADKPLLVKIDVTQASAQKELLLEFFALPNDVFVEYTYQTPQEIDAEAWCLGPSPKC